MTNHLLPFEKQLSYADVASLVKDGKTNIEKAKEPYFVNYLGQKIRTMNNKSCSLMELKQTTEICHMLSKIRFSLNGFTSRP